MKGSIGTATNFCRLSRRSGPFDSVNLPDPLSPSKAERWAGISRKMKAQLRRELHDQNLKPWAAKKSQGGLERSMTTVAPDGQVSIY